MSASSTAGISKMSSGISETLTSAEASGSNIKPSEIDISVTSESSNSVELCMRIRGLQPKKGVKKLMHKINKPKKQPHPDDLVINGKFNKWNITADSLDLDLTVEVQREDPTRYALKINKFPSNIDSDSAELTVKQPPGRNYSFIFVRARKKQPVADWKKYLADNGTLDTVEDEPEAKKDPSQ